jgi:hypothetical protein
MPPGAGAFIQNETEPTSDRMAMSAAGRVMKSSPLNVMAPPILPVAQTGEPVIVPSLPWPLESAAIIPPVSSSRQHPINRALAVPAKTTLSAQTDAHKNERPLAMAHLLLIV